VLLLLAGNTKYKHCIIMSRAVPDFGYGSGRNPALFPNPAKIQPEPDSFAGFEKSVFPRN